MDAEPVGSPNAKSRNVELNHHREERFRPFNGSPSFISMIFTIVAALVFASTLALIAAPVLCQLFCCETAAVP